MEKIPNWFKKWRDNDFHDLCQKVSRIDRLQWVMIGVSISVLGVAVAILAQYTFR